MNDDAASELCPRCSSPTVEWRGVPTCAACWATTVLALEQERRSAAAVLHRAEAELDRRLDEQAIREEWSA